MATRPVKTPGVTEIVQTPDVKTETTTAVDQSTEVVEATYDDLKEQLIQAQNKHIQLFNDPDALQARLNQLKPELANPNLTNDMAKRPERTTTTATLTDKGWLV